ncbi:RNA polymerase sigma factor [Alicyclobacillus tolerans]|uniref:RNA polymerase sigma factor n=1 Tax=Alicyclobacillus tolerans TaxID=90970 RepID=UPI001F243A79|nr:RNA polymerase sigma factor [Alicyclobacillus tolerans]MCF8568587.1 RNA polymerase sigma factor [Alicyclobacillus tolerans]
MKRDVNIEDLFRAYKGDVFTYLVYFTGHADVEDLVQETFIRAMKGISGYRHNASVKTWLYAIARNLAVDFKRRKHVVAIDEELLNLPSSDRSPEEQMEVRDTTKHILNLLGKVNAKYRDVLILRGIHELSTQETAEVLGWTTVRVNVTFHRALKVARKLIETEDGEERLYGAIK